MTSIKRQRIIIGTVCLSIFAFPVFLILGFIGGTISDYIETAKIRKHGQSLTDVEWEMVFQDCEKVYSQFKDNNELLFDLSNDQLPHSLRKFRFPVKKASTEGLSFIHRSSSPESSVHLKYYRKGTSESGMLFFRNAQVYPPQPE